MRPNNTMHRISRALLILWSALLPLQTRWIVHQGALNASPWEYGTLSVYATDALLIFAFLLLAWHERAAFWRRPPVQPASIVVAIVAFLGINVITSLTALDMGIAFAAALRLSLGVLAWWLLLKTRVRVGTLAAVIVGAASFHAVFALIQFALQMVPASTLAGLAFHEPGTAGASVVETVAGRFLRAYGLLPHPNVAAGSFLFASILGVGLLLRTRRRRDRIGLLAALALIQTGLVLTFSRAALLVWLAVLLLLTACVLMRERRTDDHAWLGSLGFQRPDPWLGLKAMQLVVLSVLLFGALLTVFRPIVYTRVAAAGRLEQRSVQERMTQITAAQAIVRDHWLLGTGIGNYTNALGRSAAVQQPAVTYQPVHVALLLVLVEIGVFGWLLLLWLIVLVVQVAGHEHVRRWRHRQPYGVPWVVCTSLALLALFAVSFFEHYFWSLQYGIMLTWLALGLWGRSLAEE